MEHSNFPVRPKEPIPIFIGAGVHIVSCRPFHRHETVKYSRLLGAVNLCLPNVSLKSTNTYKAKHTAQYNVLSDHDDAFKDSK